MYYKRAALFVTIVVVSTVAAAETRFPTVTTEGTAELTKLPDRLRLRVELVGIGDNIQLALQALEQRSQRARSILAELNAVAGSIVFEEPQRVNQDGLPIPSGGRLEPTPDLAPASALVPTPADVLVEAPAAELPSILEERVRVRSKLVADIPLAITGGNSLLLAFDQIEQRIRAVDIGDVEKLEKEQRQREADGHREPCLCGVGKPEFAFTYDPSEEEIQQLLANAFRAAERSAERLAKASGHVLGKIVKIAQIEAVQETGAHQPMAPPTGLSVAGLPSPATSWMRSGEVAQPGEMTFRVAVSATYILIREDVTGQ